MNKKKADTLLEWRREQPGTRDVCQQWFQIVSTGVLENLTSLELRMSPNHYCRDNTDTSWMCFRMPPHNHSSTLRMSHTVFFYVFPSHKPLSPHSTRPILLSAEHRDDRQSEDLRIKFINVINTVKLFENLHHRRIAAPCTSVSHLLLKKGKLNHEWFQRLTHIEKKTTKNERKTL